MLSTYHHGKSSYHNSNNNQRCMKTKDVISTSESFLLMNWRWITMNVFHSVVLLPFLILPTVVVDLLTVRIYSKHIDLGFHWWRIKPWCNRTNSTGFTANLVQKVTVFLCRVTTAYCLLPEPVKYIQQITELMCGYIVFGVTWKIFTSTGNKQRISNQIW